MYVRNPYAPQVLDRARAAKTVGGSVASTYDVNEEENDGALRWLAGHISLGTEALGETAEEVRSHASCVVCVCAGLRCMHVRVCVCACVCVHGCTLCCVCVLSARFVHEQGYAHLCMHGCSGVRACAQARLLLRFLSGPDSGRELCA